MMKYYMFKTRRHIPAKAKGKIWETQEYVDGPIRVMAEKEGYAMVRRKGLAPFVISAKDIIRDE